MIGAPLFSACFHLKVILTSFVSFGKSVISAAAGTPGLKKGIVQSPQELVNFSCVDGQATFGCSYFEYVNGCIMFTFKAYFVFIEDMLCDPELFSCVKKIKSIAVLKLSCL